MYTGGNSHKLPDCLNKSHDFAKTKLIGQNNPLSFFSELISNIVDRQRRVS